MESSAPASGKNRLFTVGMLLIPFLFFGILEGSLRLVGYGDDFPLFVEVPGYPDYKYPSRAVGQRYFHAFSAPTIPFDSFRAQKDSNTFRIVVQGGSSAAGYPYYYGGSFPDMLEQRLLQTFPGRNMEVINTAMAAVNSYTLLDLSDEIIAEDPDAVLIYAGHNEYYGALGVGSAESIGQLRPVVNLYLRLRRFRTVQALRAMLGWVAGAVGSQPEGEPPGGTLMERMAADQAIAHGSQVYQRGLDQFRGNLADLLAKYRAEGIPVFISTIASNERDQQPFVSGLAAQTDVAAWTARFHEALQAAARGDTTEALLQLDALIQADTLAADPFYAQARLLDETGRLEGARRAYLLAKDRDQLPFRAPEAINEIIREEARRHGAIVVEAHAALAEASPGGIVGSEFMLEHLHPNIDGYFRIADAFYTALRDAGAGGTWANEVPFEAARSEILVTAVDSLAASYRVRRLTAGWPFHPPGTFDQKQATFSATTPLEGIALAVYEGKLQWREAIEQLRQYYADQEDYHNALRAALAVIQRYPFLPRPYLAAGNLLARQGRFDEALYYFEASNDREETAEAQRMIGSILLRRADHTGAIRHLERARTLDPNNVQTLYNLSGAYALTSQFDDARTTVARLLEIAPEHQAGRQLLASLPR